jgi:RimJ/RimL family protein N-acetyltransferase
MAEQDTGRVLACLGVVEEAPRIAALWMMASEQARGHGLKMRKFGNMLLDMLFFDLGYHRVQVIVRVDRPEYQRWAEMFGFEKEGRMRKALPNGDDVLLYARVN